MGLGPDIRIWIRSVTPNVHIAPRPAGVARWPNLLEALSDWNAVLRPEPEYVFVQRGWLEDIVDYPWILPAASRAMTCRNRRQAANPAARRAKAYGLRLGFNAQEH